MPDENSPPIPPEQSAELAQICLQYIEAEFSTDAETTQLEELFYQLFRDYIGTKFLRELSVKLLFADYLRPRNLKEQIEPQALQSLKLPDQKYFYRRPSRKEKSAGAEPKLPSDPNAPFSAQEEGQEFFRKLVQEALLKLLPHKGPAEQDSEEEHPHVAEEPLVLESFVSEDEASLPTFSRWGIHAQQNAHPGQDFNPACPRVQHFQEEIVRVLLADFPNAWSNEKLAELVCRSQADPKLLEYLEWELGRDAPWDEDVLAYWQEFLVYTIYPNIIERFQHFTGLNGESLDLGIHLLPQTLHVFHSPLENFALSQNWIETDRVEQQNISILIPILPSGYWIQEHVKKLDKSGFGIFGYLVIKNSPEHIFLEIAEVGAQTGLDYGMTFSTVLGGGEAIRQQLKKSQIRP